jgi:hypothetical protein
MMALLMVNFEVAGLKSRPEGQLQAAAVKRGSAARRKGLTAQITAATLRLNICKLLLALSSDECQKMPALMIATTV